MFNNQRYLTRGVQADIPLVLQLFLWECINQLPEKCDDFQVFELEAIYGIQRIHHFSEQPEYTRLYCKIYNFAMPAMNCRWWLCHQEPPFILSAQSRWLCSRFQRHCKQRCCLQQRTVYDMEYLLPTISNPITTKVYVIDNGDHSTMLLAEEY